MAKQTRRPSSGAPKPSGKRTPPAPAPPAAPERPPSYHEAVALYEQSVRMLQQKNFAKAADLFRHVITTFADERELVDRAKLYLGLCQRQLTPQAAEPQTIGEFLYAATLALNAAQFDRAAGYLDHVRRKEPGNDQALYMLAVTHAQRGDTDLAIRYLQESIAANAENRVLARLDPDLEGLRTVDGVARLFDR